MSGPAVRQIGNASGLSSGEVRPRVLRAALVQETCELLGLDNVELQKYHALIRGTRGEYSVHLGSAGVMLLPGTAVPIVVVHSQHRGRLFLPFTDDDPRTAEVLSNVLLLARDRETRYPSILEWIGAGRRGGTGSPRQQRLGSYRPSPACQVPT